MLELIRAGGWPMIPLLLLSALALAIIVERFWSLRRERVLPPGLGDEVRAWVARGKSLDPAHVDSLRSTAPLGALTSSLPQSCLAVLNSAVDVVVGAGVHSTW